MTNYVRKLLIDAEAAGLNFEVHGGGDEPDYTGHHPANAEEAVNAVEEAEVVFRDAQGNKVGWALIISGLEDDECIADCDGAGWVNKWSEGVIHTDGEHP